MSLVSGFGVARLNTAIGATSSRLSAGTLRAFQTLSSPVKLAARDDETRTAEKASAVSAYKMGGWSMARITIQTATLTKLNIATSIALTTRSMAGVPDADGQNFRDGKPTLEYAGKIKKTFASMTNEQVLHFAELGIPEACRECIVRDVMVIDQIEYDEAMEVFKEIAATNREGMFMSALPFYMGLGASATAGYASIPFVFNLSTVDWFNTTFVTSELPPPEDLETWLEVGSASWGWMEPVLGQVSFFLLCMQFARSQLQNLGMRPYFNWQKQRRATYLVQQYPKYDAEFLMNYSKIDRLVSPHEMAK